MTDVRPFRSDDLPALVALSLRAWEPVYASLRQVLGDRLFLGQHPDWRADQEQAVRDTCTGGRWRVDVAERDGALAGFVAYGDSPYPGLATVEMLAVDPRHQRQGLGLLLTEHAFARLRASGATQVYVETGGDPGHAPARRTYERTGATLLPVARYFKEL